MVAFTPLALLLSLSLAISAVPLGTARVKPTTTEAWSVVPTTSSKTSTSTSYSTTSTAVKSPNCPASKPYYIESAKSCSCLPDFAYAETCSVDSKGTIVPTTCAYGYTPGWLRFQCIPCIRHPSCSLQLHAPADYYADFDFLGQGKDYRCLEQGRRLIREEVILTQTSDSSEPQISEQANEKHRREPAPSTSSFAPTSHLSNL
ncbi:hypothetical protein BCR35DRAFT_315150 [Leucosporidium creatinivorum]|uniref:Uncharacterized protein n=1 Tax=Leucosporidium creatinivorum TaxID=106004 RepID=A0A1Y2ENH8_9BASI|nr:hypothetical protein BCR35DRAFT_315150 [Leucosporidium creatinivorum]